MEKRKYVVVFTHEHRQYEASHTSYSKARQSMDALKAKGIKSQLWATEVNGTWQMA